MSFRIYEAVDDRLLHEWQKLAEEVGTRFASRPSYGLSWHRHLGRGPLRLATVRRDGRLVALLPLHSRRRLGVAVYRLLGHGLGTIGESLARDEAALTDLVSGLARSGAALELTHLPSDSPLVAAVRADPGWDATFTGDDYCPVISLPEGTRASDLRSKSTLSRAASSRRKLAREGLELAVETVSTAAQFDRRWPDIVATAAAAEEQEEVSRLNLCAPPYSGFTNEFLRREAETGHLIIWGGTFGGGWGAHVATLATHGTAELWFTRFDSRHKRCRPGHHLIEAICENHDELGVTRVDLLLGRNGYKSDWQTGEYEVGTLVAAPSGSRGVRTRMGAADLAAGLVRGGAARASDGAGRVRSRMVAVFGGGAGPATAPRS